MTVQSGVVKQGNLVSYEEWSTYVDTLKTRVSNEVTDEGEAANLLISPLREAVKKRLPKQKFGIMFSGGVDSTLIAFLCRHNADFMCYSVGIDGSEDIAESRKVAAALGLKHRYNVLTIEETERLFERTAAILKEKLDVVSLGVGAVELAAIELAKKDNITTLMGGLGSEEIFAGYQRHEKSSDINAECWSGLKEMWKRDFTRDFAIAKETGMSFLTPFLDTELIISAMSISGDLKIKDGHKKYILRKAAIKLGLNEEFAFRPKKAAQYGSNFDKAIMRIAKSKGFKFKKQYLDYLK